MMNKILCFCLAMLPLVFLVQCHKESAGGIQSTGAGGSTARFTIAGNFLYVVDNTTIKSFDISNSAIPPELKSTVPIGLNIETIFPYKDKLFVGSSTSMYIYSLGNPAKPVIIGKADYTIRMSCDPVVALDSTVYATLNGSNRRCGGTMSALVVYDIKNLQNPVLKNQITLSGPYGLGTKDNALYVCEGVNGLNVYDIRNTYSPYLVRRISGETFYDVIPYGNILICQVSTGISLYDITTPHQPVLLGRILN